LGFESNIYLWIVSKLRLFKYRRNATVELKDFWKVKIPKETKVLYVFLRDPFMQKLEGKLSKEAPKGMQLICYTFKLPNKKPEKVDGPLFVYSY